MENWGHRRSDPMHIVLFTGVARNSFNSITRVPMFKRNLLLQYYLFTNNYPSSGS